MILAVTADYFRRENLNGSLFVRGICRIIYASVRKVSVIAVINLVDLLLIKRISYGSNAADVHEFLKFSA